MADKADRLTELEAANAALAAELALYRDAVEHMHQALCVFDAEGRVLLFNSGYPKVLELPPEAVRPGVTLRDLIDLGMRAGHYPEGKSADELENGLWTGLPVNAEGRAIIV